MGSSRVHPAPGSQAIPIFLFVIAILLPAALGAEGPAATFAPEQILPVHHVVADDGYQALQWNSGPAGDLVSWATPFNGPWIELDRPGPRAIPRKDHGAAWRDTFLVSRFNTKYKEARSVHSV